MSKEKKSEESASSAHDGSTDSWLNHIQIASPCKVPWSEMTGNDKQRYCSQCKLHVYNLSDMSRQEAEEFVMERSGKGRLCIKYYRRTDGTVLTDDCPAVLKKMRSAVVFLMRVVATICSVVFSTVMAIAKDSDNAIAKESDKQPTNQARMKALARDNVNVKDQARSWPKEWYQWPEDFKDSFLKKCFDVEPVWGDEGGSAYQFKRPLLDGSVLKNEQPESIETQVTGSLVKGDDYLAGHREVTREAFAKAYKKEELGEPCSMEHLAKSLLALTDGERRVWKNKLEIATTLNNAGNCYFFDGQYARAIELYKEALSFAHEDLRSAESEIPKHVIHNLYAACARAREADRVIYVSAFHARDYSASVWEVEGPWQDVTHSIYKVSWLYPNENGREKVEYTCVKLPNPNQ